MRAQDNVDAVRRAIQAAPPYALAEALSEGLAKQYGVLDAEVLLADYGLVVLRPVISPLPPGEPGVPLDNSPQGRAFASQRPQAEKRDGYRLHLPISAHGERFGVLSMRLAEPPRESVAEEFGHICEALAHALRGADQITDRYRQTRRLARLTMAAELQWSLLPGYGHQGEGYTLAGQLQPAYAVYGDNFDWVCGPRWLTVSVSNGMGDGMPAALLTSLAITAIRNARRSGGGLEEQAGLADEAVHAQYDGDKYVSTLLLRFDAMTGDLYAVDAGSPKLLLMRGGQVREIELDRQLPLGMFGSTSYVEQHFRLEPGDRMVVVSDGVHEAMSRDGRGYGGDLLNSVIRATRLQPPTEAVRTLVRGLIDFNEGPDLADDAVIVCFDWTDSPTDGFGPSAAAPTEPGQAKQPPSV
jgi:serine phosphatase RsbU (regulator of sigma subunit)